MRCAFVLLVCAFALLPKGSSVLPNPDDVTTVVCDGAACTTPPYVYNVKGGRVIPAPSVCIVFWGTGTPVSDTVKTTIGDFFVDVFQNSDYADGWSEYGMQRRPTLHSKCGKGVSITSSGLAGASSADISLQIRNIVAEAGSPLPPVTLNTHYLIFLTASSNDCSQTCGFHGWEVAATDGLSFSVIPDYSPATNPSCSQACVGNNVVSADKNQLDWVEATKAQVTRTLANAVSNPFGDAFSDPEVANALGEVGDLCYDLSGLYQDAVNGHVVQKWYSQQRKGCVTRHLDYIAEAVACGTYDPVTLEPIPWLHHPYDCTDQYDHSRCMYCKGLANGRIVKQCLPRLGAACNPTFDTTPRAAFCNLEFECAGSLVDINVMVMVSVVLLVTMLFF